MATLGFVFLNPFAIFAAAILFAYLGFRVVQFRRFCANIADRVDVKIRPFNVTALVGTPFKVEALITNSYRLPARLVAFRLKVPSQINEETGQEELLLGPESTVCVTVSMNANSPGQFKIASTTVTLEENSRLLSHKLRLKCDAIVEVAPLANVDVALRLGSMADVSRPGTGPDLAGIREAVSEDDFRAIDWRSTARTGKFMAKQYYQENELTVIFAIDKSALAGGGRAKGGILMQLGRLIVAFGYATPIGAVLFDRREVIDQVSPSVGSQCIQRILRLLLSATTSVSGRAETVEENFTLLYSQLVDKIGILRASSRNQPLGRVDAYARSILPYYESFASKYSSQLLKQGAFRALEGLSDLPPSLVVVISGFNTDLRGLCEGAISAHASGHRIIVLVVENARDTLPPEALILRELGIQVLQTGGADMINAIRRAVVDVPVIRIKSPRQRRTSGHRLSEHPFPHFDVS